MELKKSVILQKLHVMLLKRAGPDYKIERKRLFEIISERLGRIPEDSKKKVVTELEESGIILSSDKFSFEISPGTLQR